MMEMHEYLQICKTEKVIVAVSKTQEERLKKVWAERGFKWDVDRNTGEIKFLGPR